MGSFFQLAAGLGMGQDRRGEEERVDLTRRCAYLPEGARDKTEVSRRGWKLGQCV